MTRSGGLIITFNIAMRDSRCDRQIKAPVMSQMFIHQTIRENAWNGYYSPIVQVKLWRENINDKPQYNSLETLIYIFTSSATNTHTK